MRENRPYGSEGGVARVHPDPYHGCRRLGPDGLLNTEFAVGCFRGADEWVLGLCALRPPEDDTRGMCPAGAVQGNLKCRL